MASIIEENLDAFEDLDTEEPEVVDLPQPVHPVSGLIMACDIVGITISEEMCIQTAAAWDAAPTSTRKLIVSILAHMAKQSLLHGAGLPMTKDIDRFLACSTEGKTTDSKCPAPSVLSKAGCTSVQGGIIAFPHGKAVCTADGYVISTEGDCASYTPSGLTPEGTIFPGGPSAGALGALVMMAVTGKKSAVPLVSAVAHYGKVVMEAGKLPGRDTTIEELQSINVGIFDNALVQRAQKAAIAAVQTAAGQPFLETFKAINSFKTLPPSAHLEPLGAKDHYNNRLVEHVGANFTCVSDKQGKECFLGAASKTCITITNKFEGGEYSQVCQQEILASAGDMLNLVRPKANQDKHHLIALEKLKQKATYVATFLVGPLLPTLLCLAQQTHGFTMIRGPNPAEIGIAFKPLPEGPVSHFTLGECTAAINTFCVREVVGDFLYRLVCMCRLVAPGVGVHIPGDPPSVALRFPMEKVQKWADKSARWRGLPKKESVFHFGGIKIDHVDGDSLIYLFEPEDEKAVLEEEAENPELAVEVQEEVANRVSEPEAVAAVIEPVRVVANEATVAARAEHASPAGRGRGATRDNAPIVNRSPGAGRGGRK